MQIALYGLLAILGVVILVVAYVFVLNLARYTSSQLAQIKHHWIEVDAKRVEVDARRKENDLLHMSHKEAVAVRGEGGYQVFYEGVVPRTPQQIVEAAPAPGTPQLEVVRFADVCSQVGQGQMIIGARPGGELRLGNWDEHKSILVLGDSSTGKTVTMAGKSAEAGRGGAELVFCDPHANKPDSLTRKVLPMRSMLLEGTTFAVTHEDILFNIKTAREELERRVNGGGYNRPLVLVVEEWNRLQRDQRIANELLQIAEILGQEGRGFGVYGVFGAQSVIGFARVRRAFISYIVHRIAEEEASKVIPGRYAKFAPELPTGATYVKDADGKTELLQQVLIVKRDIEDIADNAAGILPYRQPVARIAQPFGLTAEVNAPLNGTLNKQAFTPAFGERLARLTPVPNQAFTPEKNEPKRLNVPDDLRARIVEMKQAGATNRQIKDELSLHGEKYKIIQQVLQEAGLTA